MGVRLAVAVMQAIEGSQLCLAANVLPDVHSEALKD